MADDETTGLLAGKQRSQPPLDRLHHHFQAVVSSDWTDLVLLAGYMVTGLSDSASTYIWGSFVSMQTGNSVYLGLGLAAPREDTRWLRSIISISAFCFGSFCFSRWHHHFSGRKRWVMVTSYVFQTCMLIAATTIATLKPEHGPSDPVTIWIAVPLAMISFQAAGQAVMSRVLHYNALTTVVVTALYCDLFSDRDLFVAPWENAGRNRRAAAPLLLLVGAALSGVWAHSSFGVLGSLWTAAAIKGVVTLLWCCWRAEKEEGQDEPA